jgi:hypothetical protein
MPKAPDNRKLTNAAPQKRPERRPQKARPARDDSKRSMFLFLGCCLVAMSLFKFLKAEDVPQRGAARASVSGEENFDEKVSDVFGESGTSNIYWSNPEQTAFEKYFCRGNQTAASCSHRPMHPFVHAFEEAGYGDDEYLQYLPKNDNLEEDWVLGETRELSNRGLQAFE